jgi:hypothetical protein
MSNVLKATEDLTKSAQQLDEEKRHKLEERIPKLRLDGMSHEALVSIVCFCYLN